jgi:arylsulfatase
MNPAKFSFSFILPVALALMAMSLATDAFAQAKKPNILVIMGDDVGWFNVEPYHQGIMSGKTPNLMRLAKEGMRFTDYYAEASCTPGWRGCRHAGASLHHCHRA